MTKFSSRISHMAFKIQTSSAISQMVIQLEKIIFRNVWCYLPVLTLKVVLKNHCPQMNMDPHYVCNTHGFVFYLWLRPQTLVFLHLISVRNRFNLTQTRCSWKSPVPNRWKIGRASKVRVHSNTNSTVSKQIRPIRFVAVTYVKRKATQCNYRDLTPPWSQRANLKSQKLYGLTC